MWMPALASIETDMQLEASGSITTFLAVKRAVFNPSLNLLWSLQGAITYREWKDVARNDRLSLLI